VRAVGDVNADGLADLVVETFDAVHFVFGRRERLSGELELADVADATWVASGTVPGPMVPFPIIGQLLRVAAAGDVDGDGIADFVLSSVTTNYAQPIGASQPFFATYLFHGHAGAWPSGDFDPAWAAAELTVPDGTQGCSFIEGADLDGDRHSDLIVSAEGTMRLIPGAQAIRGTVNVMDDALPFVALYPRVSRVPDLDGDGRDEILWKDFAGLPSVFVTYGRSELEAPLALELDAELGASDEAVGAFAAADVNADGVNDLIVATGAVSSAPSPPAGGLYVVPGGAPRLAGHITLGEPYLLIAGASEGGQGPALGSFGLSLDASGDVTGDGIADILATVKTTDEGPFSSTQVLLVPGGIEPQE